MEWLYILIYILSTFSNDNINKRNTLIGTTYNNTIIYQNCWWDTNNNFYRILCRNIIQSHDKFLRRMKVNKNTGNSYMWYFMLILHCLYVWTINQIPRNKLLLLIFWLTQLFDSGVPPNWVKQLFSISNTHLKLIGVHPSILVNVIVLI